MLTKVLKMVDAMAENVAVQRALTGKHERLMREHNTAWTDKGED